MIAQSRRKERGLTVRRPFAQFLNELMAAGIGLAKGTPWKASALSRDSGLKEAMISLYRNAKSTPSSNAIAGLERAFFPPGGGTPSHLLARWNELKAALGTTGNTNEFQFAKKTYSSSEVWDMLLRPLRQNVTPLVRDGGLLPIQAMLAVEHIKMSVVTSQFYISPPADLLQEFSHLAHNGQSYDVHGQIDFENSSDLSHISSLFPQHRIIELIQLHARSYAVQVLEALAKRPTFPPYNKKKLGLFKFQQPQHALQPERNYLHLWFYMTDYFTHRVMRSVMRDLHRMNSSLFSEDKLFSDDSFEYLRYFLTSFGLNLVVTAPLSGGWRFYMTRLSSHQGNINQHHSLHVSANEGLNENDVVDSKIMLEQYALRTLSEELGVNSLDDISHSGYLELALDRTNFEPFLSGIVHLKLGHSEFLAKKRALARDDHRETTGIFDYEYSNEGIQNMLLDNPKGTGDFSSFSLHIMDSILKRNTPR